jgi:hypothetical protein
MRSFSKQCYTRLIHFFLFFLATLVINSAQAARFPLPPRFSATDCHPTPNTKLPQYIVAYGSLMETKSKTATDKRSGENKPVIVDHYQRGWFAKGVSVGFSTSYLAISKNANSHFNGAIFRLATPDSLKNYDKREKYYCRVAVSPALIHRLDQKTLPRAEFWIYEIKPEYIAKPSKKYPLVESYVDIFLSGCLEIEEKFHLKNFAASCIETTSDWSRYWINDRLYPRRAFVFEPNASKIDQLLANKVSYFFSQIKLESSYSS